MSSAAASDQRQCGTQGECHSAQQVLQEGCFINSYPSGDSFWIKITRDDVRVARAMAVRRLRASSAPSGPPYHRPRFALAAGHGLGDAVQHDGDDDAEAADGGKAHVEPADAAQHHLPRPPTAIIEAITTIDRRQHQGLVDAGHDGRHGERQL